jgi:hypothetical protein
VNVAADPAQPHVTREVTVLGPDSGFGEYALKEVAARRTATVACREDCELVCIQRELYRAVLKAFQNSVRPKGDEWWHKHDRQMTVEQRLDKAVGGFCPCVSLCCLVLCIISVSCS